MKNSLLLIIFLFQFLQLLSQDTFIDTRDGNEYSYFSFNQINWMTSNLKYRSTDSYCKAIKPKDEICKQYNFYPKQDLSSVCPEGWRMPKSEDWDDYWTWYYKQRIQKEPNIKLDTMMKESLTGMFWVEDTAQVLNLFAEENPLAFFNSDWIQGKRRIDRGTMNLWISDGTDNFHVHFGPVSVVKHHHKHNIEDKKRKVRQFVVRCVQDQIE